MNKTNKHTNLTFFILLAFCSSSFAQVIPLPNNWVWADLGDNIGKNLMHVVDIDGDGKKELITSGGGYAFNEPGYVYILSDDLETTQCLFNLKHPLLDYHISIDKTGDQSILTMVTSHHITQVSGKTCDYLLKEPLIHTPVQTAGLGDTNNDQIPELLYSHGNDLYKSSVNDLNNQVVKLNYGGTKIVVESLGRPGGDDIGISQQKIQLLNGDSLAHILEFDYDTTDRFDFGDLDGDGSFEVIAAKRFGYGMKAINVGSQETVFESNSINFELVRAMDVDGDGDDEILTGQSQIGDVYVLGEKGEILKTFQNLDHGVSNVLFTDLDGDGSADLLWGSGHSSTGSDHLNMAEYTTQNIIWRSTDRDGPYQLANNKLTHGGSDYLVASYSKSSSNYGPGNTLVLNKVDGHTYENELEDFTYSMRWVSAVAAADINNEGFFETCTVGEGEFSISYALLCTDGITGEVVYFRNLPDNIEYPAQMRILDIDGDLVLDTLILTYDGVLVAYDSESGFLKWQSSELLENSVSRYTGAMNVFDGTIWLSQNGQITRVNPVTGEFIDTQLNSAISHIKKTGDKVFAFQDDVGFGLFDPNTMELSEILYPATGTADYIDLSKDEKVLLVAHGTAPEFDVQLILLADGQTLWEGDMSFYSTYFEDAYRLYISDNNGIQNVNLKSFFELIFLTSFEETQDAK